MADPFLKSLPPHILSMNPIALQSAPRFIGLDLAWSARHNTAAAVIEADPSNATTGRLVGWRATLGDNNDIVHFVGAMLGTDARQSDFLAIDAPLVVPNISGLRLGDKLINHIFRRFEAGVHPANRTNLGRYGEPPGDIRGETLAARLVAEAHMTHGYDFPPRSAGRYLFECYPHSAMVVLFGLDKTLKYKRRLHRQANDRIAEYRALQRGLADLATHTPALHTPQTLLTFDVATVNGQMLKNYEDLLDALMCAYVAYYYWYWGSARNEVFGTLTEGYIVTPITPELAAQSERHRQTLPPIA